MRPVPAEPVVVGDGTLERDRQRDDQSRERGTQQVPIHEGPGAWGVALWAWCLGLALQASSLRSQASGPFFGLLVYLPVYSLKAGVTRRAFLQAAAAGLAWPHLGNAQPPTSRDALYNGIVLPSPFPPRRDELTTRPERPPYLASPPRVIPIDVGRQLFVDDFLIQESSLYRSFHRAKYHPKNPLLAPERDYERTDPYAAVTGVLPSPTAMVFSDGVFFDPADRLFKLWYMAGYQQHTALAFSHDGIAWERPQLDVVRGTNIVSSAPRDSNTVWLDLGARDARERYKMASYELGPKALRLRLSHDGIHWREAGLSGRCGDRSTFFHNPFRDVWCFSLRANQTGTQIRSRRYLESKTFADAKWADRDPVPWVAADTLDVERADLQTTPQIYNVDAVAYESVMLGLFAMYRGEAQRPRKAERSVRGVQPGWVSLVARVRANRS